jgi:hypothetical protein
MITEKSIYISEDDDTIALRHSISHDYHPSPSLTSTEQMSIAINHFFLELQLHMVKLTSGRPLLTHSEGARGIL